MIQVLKMSDFKSQNKIMNEMDIYALLYSFGLNGQLVNNIDIKTIFNYMNGERKIIVSILEDRNIIYMAPRENKSKACLVTITKELFELSEVTYKRVGNGVNQAGTIINHRYLIRANKIVNESYGLKLSFLSTGAIITYYGDLNDMNNRSNNFSIEVNPNTLAGYGREKEITDLLELNHALDLFRKSNLQGQNNINGKNVSFDMEDFTIFENGYQKKI